MSSLPNYTHALTRNLSSSFLNSLKQNTPTQPIDLRLAEQQHQNYIDAIRSIIPHLILLEAENDFPDCNFIEDTAVIVGNTAAICCLGAPERRGEEAAITNAIKSLGFLKLETISLPGTVDGGDVLYTGKHLFVGLSCRTNKAGASQLKAIFQDKTPVYEIFVQGALHLKSIISFLDHQLLVVEDGPAGKEVQAQIEKLNLGYQFLQVPDREASNVLRIGSHVLIQDGFPSSIRILETTCSKLNLKSTHLKMSELIKADGALTCGSLLFTKS